MSEVNVSLKDIQNYEKVLSDAEKSIRRLMQKIQTKIVYAKNTWDDNNYSKLEALTIECVEALKRIYELILDGEKYLKSIETIVSEYDDFDFQNGLVDRGVSQSGSYTRRKSEIEKLQDFKSGIADIDQIIEDYCDELEARGLQKGPVMNVILDQYRNQLQAELLRNINGDFSKPVQHLTSSDLDILIDNCRTRGWLTAEINNINTPRTLSATSYGFTTQNINGTMMRVYDDPVGTNSMLIQQQGNSFYDMEGTCGLCQCSNMLTLAGVRGSDENSIISAAMHGSDSILNCMELFNPYSEERGGTTVRDRQELLSRCGLDTYCLPVSYDRSETTHRLAEAVQTGHGVIVSVDVAYLWRNGQSGGHAISLISVSEDGGTFIYNDTGSGRMGTISSHELARALTGRPANVTTSVIR